MSPPRSRTLLVVALWAEALPLLRRQQGQRWIDRRLVLGTLAGAPVALLRCGVGRTPARDRAEESLARVGLHRALSLGTCGALVDELRIGQVLCASSLLDSPVSPELTIPGATPVVLATVPKPVFHPARRRAWAERGAEACEMEAAGVAEACEGMPFGALKVVSDAAGGSTPRARWLPRTIRRAAFQLLALGLMDRKLAPVLEAWLREP